MCSQQLHIILMCESDHNGCFHTTGTHLGNLAMPERGLQGSGHLLEQGLLLLTNLNIAHLIQLSGLFL